MPREFLSASVSPQFAEAVRAICQSKMTPASGLIRQALAELLRAEGHDVSSLWSPRKGGKQVQP
jgi:hypothetical protein